MKKIVYIAHPISGDIEANLADLRRILRIINMNEHPLIGEYKEINNMTDFYFPYNFESIIPLAPYVVNGLDDTIPLERKRGMYVNDFLLEAGIFKELWLTGDKISFGMSEEVKLAVLLGIPIIDYIGKI